MSFAKQAKRAMVAEASDVVGQAEERWSGVLDNSIPALRSGEKWKLNVEDYLQKAAACTATIAALADKPRYAGQKATMVEVLNRAKANAVIVHELCDMIEESAEMRRMADEIACRERSAR